jgi:hypothetical protein
VLRVRVDGMVSIETPHGMFGLFIRYGTIL